MKKADLENSKAIASASLSTWGAVVEIVYIDEDLQRVYYRTIIGDNVSKIHFSTIKTISDHYRDNYGDYINNNNRGFITYRGEKVSLNDCVRTNNN